MNEANRYVRVRCPICNDVSPICDQEADIRRESPVWEMRRWPGA
jgi:hypothetical protein